MSEEPLTFERISTIENRVVRKIIDDLQKNIKTKDTEGSNK